MSSSDQDKSKWGTVYMGGSAFSLDALEGSDDVSWSEADEAAYLERVRRKAVALASDIMSEAKAEAGSIRDKARREGYDEGLAQAEQEIEEFRNNVSASVAGVLSAIEGQCSAIFADWREDLVTLLRLAAEKAIGMPLVEDRARLLEEVYVQAVTALENRRALVIRVSTEDEAAIADIVAMTQSRFPDLKSWSVKADASVSPGGLIVESEDSLADNRLEKRVALVNEILRNVSLPQD